MHLSVAKPAVESLYISAKTKCVVLTTARVVTLVAVKLLDSGCEGFHLGS